MRPTLLSRALRAAILPSIAAMFGPALVAGAQQRAPIDALALLQQERADENAGSGATGGSTGLPLQQDLERAETDPSLDDEQGQFPPEGPRRVERVRVAGGVFRRGQADYTDGDGRVDSWRSLLAVQYLHPINEQLSFAFGFSGEWRGFSFSGTDPFSAQAGGRAFNDLIDFSLTFDVRYRLDERWTLSSALILGFAGEPDAEIGDSFTIGGRLGVLYRFSDTLALGPGFYAGSRIEDSVLIIPVLLVDWQFDEQLALSNVRGAQAFPVGAGAELSWTPNRQFEAALGARWQQSRWRLDDRGPATSSEGVFEQQDIPVWLRGKWQINETWRIDALVGIALGTSQRLEDRNGNRIFDADVDPAPIFGVMFQAKF